jgi:hypothetical protein
MFAQLLPKSADECARKSGTFIDQARIHLNQRRSGTNLLPGIIRRENASDANDRKLASATAI